jgi:hypothetical protein
MGASGEMTDNFFPLTPALSPRERENICQRKNHT